MDYILLSSVSSPAGSTSSCLSQIVIVFPACLEENGGRARRGRRGEESREKVWRYEGPETERQMKAGRMCAFVREQDS